MPCGNTIRVEFTHEHDAYLTKYLARYCPSKGGRNGNAVYKQLVANVNDKWPWSVHHPWQSWRTRYVKNSIQFDSAILKYQRKHSNESQEMSLKRPAEPMPIELLGGPRVKRARVKLTQDEDSSSSSETRQQPEAPANSSATSPSKPTSKQSQPPSSQARPSAPVPDTYADDTPPTPFTPTPKPTSKYPRPLSHPRSAASVTRTCSNGIPGAPTTHDRAEEAGSSTKWPPVRSHAAQKKASRLDAETEARLLFSPLRPPSGVEVITKEERARARQRPSDPFARDLESSDRRAAVARLSGKTRQQATCSTEVEPGKDMYRNGKRDRTRERAPVPSVDLVAVSSARSYSRSSTDASAPAKAQRRSLPAFGYSVPWVFEQPRGLPSAPSSALRAGTSSPFKWAVPSPVYGHTTSSPSLRSILGVTDPGTSSPVSRPRPSLNLMPHPPDMSLTASHGLASILDRMSANHGMAVTVVEAVYKRVGNLREADEVLSGMREAAESFGQKDIDRRMKGWRRGEGGRQGRHRGTTLRHATASENGNGSEYSPPETSRAALWKRQSGSGSHTDEDGEEREEREDGNSGSVSHNEEDGEGVGEDSGDNDEEEADGRAVEAELGETEDENDEDMPHDFSQQLPVAGEEVVLQDVEEERLVADALVTNKEAQKLEKWMGRDAFHKAVVERFRFT